MVFILAVELPVEAVALKENLPHLGLEVWCALKQIVVF
jgi:hypothetical protein